MLHFIEENKDKKNICKLQFLCLQKVGQEGQEM